MRFHVARYVPRLYYFGAETEYGEEGGEYLVVAALCFADRIGGPLSFLSRHICDRIRSHGSAP